MVISLSACSPWDSHLTGSGWVPDPSFFFFSGYAPGLGGVCPLKDVVVVRASLAVGLRGLSQGVTCGGQDEARRFYRPRTAESREQKTDRKLGRELNCWCESVCVVRKKERECVCVCVCV